MNVLVVVERCHAATMVSHWIWVRSLSVNSYEYITGVVSCVASFPLYSLQLYFKFKNIAHENIYIKYNESKGRNVFLFSGFSIINLSF